MIATEPATANRRRSRFVTFVLMEVGSLAGDRRVWITERPERRQCRHDKDFLAPESTPGYEFITT
jgi:hypothetical protein